MNKEELAEQLNGIQYRTGIPPELLQLAKENGLVIVTGASDDLIEFEGAFEDEGGCYQGDTFYINDKGILEKPDPDKYDESEEGEDRYHKDFKKYLNDKKKGRAIVAEWCVEEDYSWTYTTSLPHASFDLMEDDEKYCRGIIIDINDLK